MFTLGISMRKISCEPWHSFHGALPTELEVHIVEMRFQTSRHLSRRLPIFTRRFQRTILGTSELNFCVRNGNRWNLTVIVTDQYDWFSITFLFYFVQYFLKDVPSKLNNHCSHFIIDLRNSSELWSSPRSISTHLLNGSLHLHIVPINLVVYKGSYLIESVGYLIFGSASRLDAFSVYPIRT